MASQSGQIGRSVSPSGRAIVLKGAMNVCRGMLVEKGCVTLTHSSPDHRGHTTPRKELCCQGNVRSVIRGYQRAFLMHARDARRHARSDRVQFWKRSLFVIVTFGMFGSFAMMFDCLFLSKWFFDPI